MSVDVFDVYALLQQRKEHAWVRDLRVRYDNPPCVVAAVAKGEPRAADACRGQVTPPKRLRQNGEALAGHAHRAKCERFPGEECTPRDRQEGKGNRAREPFVEFVSVL